MIGEVFTEAPKIISINFIGDIRKPNTGVNISAPERGFYSNGNFAIIKEWNHTLGSLQRHPLVNDLADQMGFDLPTLVTTLNRSFSNDLVKYPVYKDNGEKIEEVGSD